MKLRQLCLTTLTAATLLLAPATHAHNLWLQPSSTVLSKGGWITVDAAVSNDLFYFNHVPLQLDNLQVTTPSGGLLAAQNPHRGRLRSVFDLELTEVGTYRVAVATRGIFASYKLNGERKRWRGQNLADLEKEIPAGAEELVATESGRRIETFVTVGKPSAVRAVGSGLEMLPVSHPNDLVSGERATFAIVLDGKPVAGAKVSVIRGGTRYRDQLEDQTLETGADGRFSVEWKKPGMYWLEIGHED
jgi:uncharacterized GH25 family protein